MITHTRSEFVTRWFCHHAKCQLQKNFSKCSLTKESQIPTFEENVPVIAVSNHSSWWDALLGLYVGQYVFKKEMYGVFKEEQLRRYGIFRFVGAYSVDQESLGDVKEFLRYTHELLKDTSRLLWIYPQGTLSSNVILPFDFKKGFANIAARFKKVHIFKMVVSYDFWIEPKPEIVIDFLPLETLEPQKGSAFQDALTERVCGEMTARMREIQKIIGKHDTSKLEPLFVQEHGANVIYDVYRKAKATLKGETFKKSHGME